MPLSEEEQRALRDIEASFHKEDPTFERRVDYEANRRRLRGHVFLGALGGLVCLISIVLTFTKFPTVAFVAFLFMVASGFWAAKNIRRLSAIAVSDLVDDVKSRFPLRRP